MNSNKTSPNKHLQTTTHDFLIYKDGNDEIKVRVMLINNDLWLTQDLIAELFGTARSTITEHINNILKDGELKSETSVGISDISSGGRRFYQKITDIYSSCSIDYDKNSEITKGFFKC